MVGIDESELNLCREAYSERQSVINTSQEAITKRNVFFKAHEYQRINFPDLDVPLGTIIRWMIQPQRYNLHYGWVSGHNGIGISRRAAAAFFRLGRNPDLATDRDVAPVVLLEPQHDRFATIALGSVLDRSLSCVTMEAAREGHTPDILINSCVVGKAGAKQSLPKTKKRRVAFDAANNDSGNTDDEGQLTEVQHSASDGYKTDEPFIVHETADSGTEYEPSSSSESEDDDIESQAGATAEPTNAGLGSGVFF